MRQHDKVNYEIWKKYNQKHKAFLIKELKKQRRIKNIFNIIGVLFGAAVIAIVIIDPPASFYMYIICAVMVVLLLTAAALHIRFQYALATRRPPQMLKKGALYDEG